MRTRAIAIIGIIGAIGVFGSTMAGAAPGTTSTLQAGLNGRREVPGPGDANGSGHARITIDTASNEICWELRVRNIDGTVTGAHIHVGRRDAAGAVVQALTPPTTGRSSGCAVNAAVADAIAADPAGYYVNVHSSAHEAGAVRGQLAGRRSASS